ncbi:MAG: hypothetical protein VB055_07465 [Oscillospiraceae bacterium]|nr:hypothetical protein [Oscillospiraceae bacterium]
MSIRYFLGANSAGGFFSHYDELLPARQRLRILKGGPGCGKSTLMKRVAEEAERLGLAAERIPCSSDPDSLDGIVVPDLGYAVADGTAPHIVEPVLCGCGEVYLDLGRGYDAAALFGIRDTLRSLSRAAGDCFPAATACLRAAADLEPLLATERKNELTPALALSLCEKELPDRADRADQTGAVRRVFLSGHTPEGRICYWETVAALCPRVYVLHGAAAHTSALLQTIGRVAAAKGWDTRVCDSPLLPGQLTEHLLIPALGLALVTSTPSLPYPGKDGRHLGNPNGGETLYALQHELLQQAFGHLRRAKEYHDLLEAAYRPFVDFSVADKGTEFCCAELHALWEAQR